MNKIDILGRKNYLQKIIELPVLKLIKKHPNIVGFHFQSEWTIYTYGMFAQACANIAKLYPETKNDMEAVINTIINKILNDTMQLFDRSSWGEDSLEFNSTKSHLAYQSILAWAISNHMKLTKNSIWESLYEDICQSLVKKFYNSPNFLLQTYPGETYYIPDNLVAIIALKRNSKYQSFVEEWLSTVKNVYIDQDTGLVMSSLYNSFPEKLKGSYAALNCYYLTMVDTKFAKQQYELFKKYFINKFGIIEDYNNPYKFSFDIDAGPIIFGLSPSGNAFALGAAIYFNDKSTIRKIKLLATLAGIPIGLKRRHYLLANIVPVGEAIMLASKTNK